MIEFGAWFCPGGEVACETAGLPLRFRDLQRVVRGEGVLLLAAAVAAFLADQAEAGVRPSTLSRRVAASAYAHHLVGLALPDTFNRARRAGRHSTEQGAKPAQKAPATAKASKREYPGQHTISPISLEPILHGYPSTGQCQIQNHRS